MPDVLPVSEIRGKFDEIASRVHFGGERIAMQRHGKTIAVLVPPSDLDMPRVLEERLDLLDALDALAITGRTAAWISRISRPISIFDASDHHVQRGAE